MDYEFDCPILKYQQTMLAALPDQAIPTCAGSFAQHKAVAKFSKVAADAKVGR